MASVTSWTRLEPRARNEEMSAALQARVWDPLWLLARQWQVGELDGEDAGSPAVARLSADCAPLGRYLAGPLQGGAADRTNARAFDGAAMPLESRVERERLHEEPLPAGPRDYANPRTNLRVAAEAGQHFRRLLAAKGVSSQSRDRYRDTFPLREATPAEAATLDADTLRWLSVVSGRVVDGTALYATFAPYFDAASGTLSRLPDTPDVRREADAVKAAAEAWLRWYGALFSELAPGEASAWSAERMEYQFAVAAPSPGAAGELVLEAPEYAEGRLDWHAFNARPDAALGAGGASTPLVRTAIPTPVRYPGMPANGWFEMEDARVNLGAVDAAPEDLARMLVVDFALVYSDDWFVIPVEVDVGSLCRVRSLEITDTFGERTPILHYTRVDEQPSGWRMFSLTSTRGGDAAGDVLFLPPAVGSVVESRPVEDVLLLRDENANMAWAVERVVESAAGRPLDRLQLAQERRRRLPAQPPRAGGATPAPLVYGLVSAVPENWIPLVPRRVVLPGGRATIRLLRARMLETRGGGAPPERRGRILEADAALALYDETVPRAGARVTRAYQLARWTDGSTHLWAGRRTDSGRGEGSSGLRFDVVEQT